MRRLFRLALVMIIIFLGATLYGDDTFRPVSFEAITVDSTAGGKAFTVAKYFDVANSRVLADSCIMVNETAQIRFTVDGTTVTATVGTPLQVNQGWILDSFEELKNFRAIATGSSSGSLKVIFYKRYK